MSQHLPLHRAVERNDLKELSNLLKEKGNVNERDNTLKTPLHVACTQNRIPIVTELLTNGADVNAMDSNNWTPLHCAATEGRFEILEILLAHPEINPHILSQDGTSMFHYLVRFKPEQVRQEMYLKMLQRCLDVGIDVNLPGKHLETPIHQATMKKNILAVQFLLEHKANVNVKNKSVF
jgi:ankyrin repeat protein